MGFLGTSWVLNTMAPRNRYQVQFFRLQKLNRKIAYCCIRSTYIRRCSLVLSASFAASAFLLLMLLLLLSLLLASAAAASAAAAAAAAAAATALRTAGWSCSVFLFSSSNSLAKATW